MPLTPGSSSKRPAAEPLSSVTELQALYGASSFARYAKFLAPGAVASRLVPKQPPRSQEVQKPSGTRPVAPQSPQQNAAPYLPATPPRKRQRTAAKQTAESPPPSKPPQPLFINCCNIICVFDHPYRRAIGSCIMAWKCTCVSNFLLSYSDVNYLPGTQVLSRVSSQLNVHLHIPRQALLLFSSEASFRGVRGAMLSFKGWTATNSCLVYHNKLRCSFKLTPI